MIIDINAYEADLEKTAAALRANNMNAVILENGAEALAWVKERLVPGSKVAIGGSNTLRDIGVTGYIEDGDFQYTNRYKKGVPFAFDPSIPKEVVRQSYMDAFDADFYLMSSNAITEEGDLVNVDGMGNRVAALAYGPRNVFVIAGKNKVVKDLPAAFERLQKIICQTYMGEQRNIDTPCRKLGKCIDCKSPNRPCAIYSIMRHQNLLVTDGVPRITVVLVKEVLGF